MTHDQIKAGLLALDAQHPFYQALIGLLESDIDDEGARATLPNLTDGQRQFATGRLAHAREIRFAIESVIAEAAQERATALAKAQRQSARAQTDG